MPVRGRCSECGGRAVSGAGSWEHVGDACPGWRVADFIADDELDERLLRTVEAYWPEWVSADNVRRGNGLSAVGAGRILARLARAGRCEVRSNGYMNEYRRHAS